MGRGSFVRLQARTEGEGAEQPEIGGACVPDRCNSHLGGVSPMAFEEAARNTG